MCGIVAVIGAQDAPLVLLEGLERLEYRGYDSAGLAVSVPGTGVARVRAVGKVRALASAVPATLRGEAGIAHTRWATHGAVTEANAHPHRAGRVHLVHNGMIENFKTLRAELAERGRGFESETDSEVIAHLIDEALETGAEPEAALRAVLDRLEGAFALAALIDGAPGAIYGARRGAPLAAGLGAGAAFLTSDALALGSRAERLVFLEDGDVIVVRPGGLSVTDAAGRPAVRPETAAQRGALLAEKGPYRHFMEKEIHEQPEVVGRTLAHYVDALEDRPRPIEGVDFADASRLITVACGTAAYAGLIGEYWFERLAGLSVEVDIASEFRYRDPALSPGEMALFISQSGETADTLEALRLCNRQGLSTLALVNTPYSTMASEAGRAAPTLAGPEIGVASTKAFTCQLAALGAMAILAGLERGRLTPAEASRHIADLMAAPTAIAQTLALEGAIQGYANDLAAARLVLYIGRNQYFPMALEGALKLKEISYIHAEGYAAGELKHGPIALVEEGVAVIAVAPFDALFAKTRSSIEQVKARGARLIAVTDPAGAEALEDAGVETIVTPRFGPMASVFAAAAAVQLLAYHVAVHRGTDVDQPRNLAKSVTVE